MKKLNIVVHAYDPATVSGMGIVAKELIGRLPLKEHNVIWVAPNGISREWNDCQIISPPDVYSITLEKILKMVIYNSDPDIFISNMNWQSLVTTADIINEYSEMTNNSFPILFHSPIESENKPPGFEKDFLAKRTNPAHYIPFTKPHYELFADKDWCRTYIPHGVRSQHYGSPRWKGKILSLFDKEVNDLKIVATVASNERRKNLDQWLKSASKIKELYDGNVRFVMHTPKRPMRDDSMYSGWDLPKCASSEGIEPGEDIVWTKDYPGQQIPPEFIDSIYNDSSVYLSLSGGEGFGMPILEAMSRGTPSVLSNHINHRWLAQDSAVYVSSNYKYRISTGDQLKVPDANEAATKVANMLENDDERAEKSAAGAERASYFRWQDSSQMLLNYIQRIL